MNISTLRRDPITRMVINSDKQAYEAARARKLAAMKKIEEEERLKKRVDTMESKVDRILELLEEKNSG